MMKHISINLHIPARLAVFPYRLLLITLIRFFLLLSTGAAIFVMSKSQLAYAAIRQLFSKVQRLRKIIQFIFVGSVTSTAKRFVFLTNNSALVALIITQLYKCRWQVELFFKWIKQHLRIKSF